MKRCILILLTLLFMAACSNVGGQSAANENKTEIVISAATSLSNVLEEIIPLFEEKYPDTTITLNLGGSGKLAQQIQQGAPADIYLSADQHFMNELESQNLIINESRTDFAKNSLVLISSKDLPLKLDDLDDLITSEVEQIAIGNPDSVPAGSYAKEALVNVGIWNNQSIQEELVYAKDVRQVLTYVSSKNADLGFVYQSDLNLDESVKSIMAIDNTLHTPISYPAAVIANSENPDIAKEMIDFICSSDVQSIFKKYGFTY